MSSVIQRPTPLFRPSDFKWSWRAVADPGWLRADGTLVATATYPALFAAIGHTANGGVDPGGGQFRLPLVENRFVIGAYAGKTLGAVGGAETHQLSIAEMPSHDHGGATGVDAPDHAHGYTVSFSENWTFVINPGAGYSVNKGTAAATTGGRTAFHTHGISAQGGGAAHNNMPPWIALYCYVKT